MGWTPPARGLLRKQRVESVTLHERSRIMSKVTIAVDLAKDIFEVAVATASGTIIERKRLTRAQFERFWHTHEPCSVVMEACAGAHHWARQLIGLGLRGPSASCPLCEAVPAEK